TLLLQVRPRPVIAATLPAMLLCDVTNTGDGEEAFNLTGHIPQIIGNQVGLTVTFHTTQGQAQAGNNAIATPNAYNNTSNPQTVWVRIANAAGCFVVRPLTLQVNPLPQIIDPTPFVVCSTSNNATQGIFELSQKNDEITQANPNYIVSYHLTQAQAQAGTNALAIPYTGSNGQTLFVRVQDGTTGCVSLTTLTLT
ncbi:hypothetical protein V6O07_05260, partial [Arthrospira platensis SPKY2]